MSWVEDLSCPEGHRRSASEEHLYTLRAYKGFAKAVEQGSGVSAVGIAYPDAYSAFGRAAHEEGTQVLAGHQPLKPQAPASSLEMMYQDEDSV